MEKPLPDPVILTFMKGVTVERNLVHLSIVEKKPSLPVSMTVVKGITLDSRQMDVSIVGKKPYVSTVENPSPFPVGVTLMKD